jgi:replicative DNA helicase
LARSGDRIGVALQENLLVLLAFDKDAATIIRNTIDVRLFGSQQYRDLATRIYEYIDEFKQPPGEHLPDLFEEELEKEDAAGDQLGDLIAALHGQREKVNRAYALSELAGFVRQQSLKSSIISASEFLQEGDLDSAERTLQVGMKQRLQSFQPGQRLADGIRMAFSGQVRKDIVPTGIKEFDRYNLGCARGEFELFIGPPKRGKSWWLINRARRALMAKLKPLYITLELSEAQILQRMLQAFFSMTRSKAKVPVTRLRTDDLGRLVKFEADTVAGRMAFSDVSVQTTVEKKLARMHGHGNFLVKQFPAGQLTVPGLIAYLDMLEQSEGYVPDVLVIDYPDYFKIDPRNFRFEMGALLNDLRGLAVERNCAVCAAKRSNREGTKARMVTEIHMAEDYSGMFTADTIFTYSQTPAEKNLHLARVFAGNTRVADRDGIIALVSQAYEMGQFVLDSVLMQDTYFGMIESEVPVDDRADE